MRVIFVLDAQQLIVIGTVELLLPIRIDRARLFLVSYELSLTIDTANKMLSLTSFKYVPALGAIFRRCESKSLSTISSCSSPSFKPPVEFHGLVDHGC